MKSTIQEVAKWAGVSTATVSRAFNTPDLVTQETRTAVQRAATAVAYVPNASARTLRTQRSRVLGVVLPSLLNPVFAECLQGVAKAAMSAGYSIMPITTEYKRDVEDQAVEHLSGANVDGLILVVSDPGTSHALQRLAAGRIPYVLAYNRHAAHPCVSIDGQAAVAELVLRLARLGHRHIAMVSGVLTTSDRAQQRYRGYLAGMRAAKLRNSLLVEVPFVESGVGQIVETIATAPRPTALVCSNDLLAIRCIRAAHLAGLRVPEDITVTGFDGIALGQDMTPMLSTVVQPNDLIGSRCVELIVQALASDTPLRSDSSIEMGYQFRDGESCAAPSASAAAPRAGPTVNPRKRKLAA
jgi:LacI family transcriptional regulator, repressor for deo operon, udp, cdd, tsx, nupC, and nupG